MSWTEGTIGAALARNTFKSHLVVVPNCTWTGHECDLLVVADCLRLIDVEVKISRADLKADARKDKWWRRAGGLSWRNGESRPPDEHRDWPPHVWKHYYAMPRDIWKSDLLDCLGSSASGVIVIGTDKHPDKPIVEVMRRARPNRDAKPIEALSMQRIARLASLRMWDAFRDVERVRDDARRTRAALQPGEFA